MLNPRSICLAFVAMIGLTIQAAEEIRTIPLGQNLQVHPTRFFAKRISSTEEARQQCADLYQRLALEAVREYKLVPGLVVLDAVQGGLAPQAVAVPTPEFELAQLLRRMKAVRDSGLFEYVEPNLLRQFDREPADAAYLDGRSWGLRNTGANGGSAGADISAAQAWDITVGSRSVILAVVDSGVRYDHVDLAANMWVNYGEIPANGIDDDGNGYIDDIHGIDAVTGVGDPQDSVGHGTHVAGTIGAAANNGRAAVGVIWEVQLMAVRIGGATGIMSEDIVTGFEYAVANGARAMNASFGGYGYSSAEYDAVQAAGDAGVMLLAAAGNDNVDNDFLPHYPSSFNLDNVITVASLTSGDDRSDFSNFGVQSVDLGAPGSEIFSTWSTTADAYDTISGTSMAAPHVTGVVGLILAAYPEASLLEVRQRLLNTVVKIPALDGVTATGGRVNAFHALEVAPTGELTLFVDPGDGAVILGGRPQVIEVSVIDAYSVLGATVTGTVVAHDINLTFLDDGVAPDQKADDGVYTATLDVPEDIEELTLEVDATAANKLPANVEVVYVVIPPPPNDDFEDASKFPQQGGVVESNNEYATIQLDEPFHAGDPMVAATLWWNWSPGISSPVLIDTSGSSFATVLAVYTGTTLGNLVEVAAAADTDGNSPAYVQFDAVAGTTYRIVVGGYNPDEVGTIRLRIEYNGAPDTLAPQVAFKTADGYRTEVPEVIVEGYAFDPQPNASGVRVVILRAAGDFLTKSAAGTTNWSAPFSLKEGINVIEAYAVDFAMNVGPTRSISLWYVPQDPSNDYFVNASALGETNLVAADNRRATKQEGEPLHAGNTGGKSLWWSYTAESDGMLTLTTTNSSFDTLLSVYTGSEITNLVTLGANDDATPKVGTSEVSVGVRAGVKNSIAVDGFAASSGDIQLAYSFIPGSVYELQTIAGDGGTVQPPTAEYLDGIEVQVTATPAKGYLFDGWSGSVESDVNPLTVVVSGDMTVQANFRLPEYTDGYETGGFNPALPYVMNPAGSSAPWFVQSATAAEGEYAAGSGAIGARQTSALSLDAEMDDGVGSFALRVSSENNFDRLVFLVDDIVVGSWMGEVSWRTFDFEVAKGPHRLEWRYEKDSSISAGLDAAYLDNLVLPLASDTGTEPEMALARVNDGVQVMLRGTPGRIYIVEVSEDLANWTPVGTVLAEGGVIPVVMPAGSADETRFYRAVKP